MDASPSLEIKALMRSAPRSRRLRQRRRPDRLFRFLSSRHHRLVEGPRVSLRGGAVEVEGPLRLAARPWEAHANEGAVAEQSSGSSSVVSVPL